MNRLVVESEEVGQPRARGREFDVCFEHAPCSGKPPNSRRPRGVDGRDDPRIKSGDGHDGDLQAFCQAFPNLSCFAPSLSNIPLAVLWDFNGLQGVQTQKVLLQIFDRGRRPAGRALLSQNVSFSEHRPEENPSDRRPRLPLRSESLPCVAKAVRIVARS